MTGLLDRAGYLDFLRGKFRFTHEAGVVIDRADINPMLKPHQGDIVEWAGKKGRAAIFASFGLGKTVCALELCRLILAYLKRVENRDARALIVLPLGVRAEFINDAAKLGIAVTFVQSTAEITAHEAANCIGSGIYLTNYESVREGKIDVGLFEVASLDEAAILRSLGSRTSDVFFDVFKAVRYRFVATAVPSPNDYIELIRYAVFLGIADSGAILNKYFERDSTKAGNLTLRPHMEAEFWAWLHSWALFITKPSDLGYDDTGYDLPDLTVRVHYVTAADLRGGVDRDGQGLLIKDAALGLPGAAREKRESLAARVAKAAQIVASAPDDHFILWHDLEDERRALKKAIPGMVEVFGTLELTEREARIKAFADGHARLLGTKPSLSGSGCNLQRHCHRAIFVGVGYKFHEFVQSVHRVQRFGQPHACEIDIIACETEREIVRELFRKWDEHKALGERMGEMVREHGVFGQGMELALERTLGVERKEVSGQRFLMAFNDTVYECDQIEAGSIHCIVTSIPFGNQYGYVNAKEDFGHNSDNAKFFDQMDHLTPNLLRILAPGREMCVHVKDRIRFGNMTGYGFPSLDAFHADCINHFKKHGFILTGIITVVTDVVADNNQTYRLGYTEMRKDSTKMSVGCPEYILIFRKLPSDTSNGYADVPVEKTEDEYSLARWQVDAHAFWRSSGDRLLSAEELMGYGPDVLARVFTKRTLETIYDYHAHVAIGEALEKKDRLPKTFMAIAPGSHQDYVWHDVMRVRTLNSKQAQKNLIQHVCPLSIDLVERLIARYSSKGETVFDPFAGIGTVPWCAIRQGRYGRGVELNPISWRDGVRHCAEADAAATVPTLFDLEGFAAPEKAA